MNEFLTAIAHFILGLMKGVLTCFGGFILANLISCLVDRLRDMAAKRKDKQAASLESTTSQVSKALCGKENATAEEIIAAFDQVKRERDAAVKVVKATPYSCEYCKHNKSGGCYSNPLPYAECFEYRGVKEGKQ